MCNIMENVKNTKILTFVYDGTEVFRTGRIAKASNLKSGSKPHLSQILVEIRPIDKEIEWKKWVKQSELFEITDDSSYFNQNNDKQFLIEIDEGDKCEL